MEKIAIASGKGGVGKTSITLIIANHLKNQGYKVGLLDADIYGPNLTQIFISENSKYSITHDKKLNKFTPLTINKMLMNSIDFVVDKEKAAIWRGPVLSKAIKQLYLRTDWGNLDYLFIDMPPGTGDAYITILNDLDINDVILVAVEDDFCIADLHKTNALIKKFKKNCLGIIENMSENFSFDMEPVKSERLEHEFNLNILFTLPRISRNEFYKELNNLDKLKSYIPDKIFK